MATEVVKQAVQSKWIAYDKQDGLRIHFGLKDWLVLWSTLTISPNLPGILEFLLEVIT